MVRGNASHQGGGGVTTASTDKQMAAFDALPKSVREHLSEALFDWPAYPIRRWWEQGRYKNAKALCRAISEWDRKELKRSARA